MKKFFAPNFALHCAGILLVGVAALTCSSAAFAQGQTSLGTDFWVGFMPNSFYLNCCPPENVELFIGSGTDNDVHVDVYAGTNPPSLTYHQKMQANTVWSLPAVSEGTWETLNPAEEVQYKAIHVYSKNPIVVYGYQYTGVNTSSTDSYLGIPTPALGTEYYPSCYYDDQYTLGPNNPLAGQFLIISPYDNNTVTIGPVTTDTRQDANASTILHHQGETWSITLQKGQTYLVQSTGLHYGDADLTGTHITSSEPIALISGHQLASIPIGELAASNGSKDEVMEEIPPVSEWGSEYYDMPTATRTICGDLVRVIAGEPGVVVSATSDSGTRVTTLTNPGDFYDFDQVTDPTVFASQGGKKFLAVQMAYSQNYLGDPGLSDPFSIVLTPKQQFQKKMIFNTPDRTGVAGFVHYGTFLCRTDSILKIQINGKSISSYVAAGELPIPGTNPPMSAYRLQLPGNGTTYLATCGAPFGCYLYGWSTYESYGHPAGMALGTPSPDTLPPLEKHDSTCGGFQAELMELRHMPQFSFEDTRISDVALITDTLDTRWPIPSYNFTFSFDPQHPFTPGDSIAYYDLNVINPGQNAYAAVWTTDKAGNDTVYQYYYYPPKIDFTPPLPIAIQPVVVSSDSCQIETLVNQQAGDLVISGASIEAGDTMGTFTLSPSTVSETLHSGDTLKLQLCYTPKDTLTSFDTLVVTLETGCTQFKYPIQALGITPLIVAGDLDFGNVTVGDTACKTLTVKNVGKAPLTLNKNWLLDDNANFSFSDASQLPLTLAPGARTTLTFCFHPQNVGAAQTLQHWGTDLPGWFAHQIKDTSQLLGFGVQAGLNWDRPKQAFFTECSDTVMDTVYIMNPSTGGTGSPMTVDSVVISGPDADEFSMVTNQFGYLPKWALGSGDVKWVLLRFAPNLSKGYGPRNAVITAYGSSGDKSFNPSITLTGTVRHSTIRITPSTHNFDTVEPNAYVTSNFWIHNDGDTTLDLTSLSIGGGFTISGFTPGQQILPGDSAMVTVADSVQPGQTLTALIASGPVPCTDTGHADIVAFASNFLVTATGHDFGNVYVCQNGSADVHVKNIGLKDAVIERAQILDTMGTTGASQYHFSDGSQTMNFTDTTTLHTNDSMLFTINYNPVVGGGTSAFIAYTIYNPLTGEISIIDEPLSGVPLHYTNTLSVQNTGSSGVYTAYPGDPVDVPVQMNTTLDANAGIYQIQFTLRYRRDMFVPNPTPVLAAGGLQVIGPPTTTFDPADTNYVLTKITVGSNTPITQVGTIAHLQMEYVLNKDSISTLTVLNPVFLDKSGNPACWVSHDTIPGAFAGLDRCGDVTIRNFLSGVGPNFDIVQISPNPAGSEAKVDFQVLRSGETLTIEVYNSLGKRQWAIVSGLQAATGEHSISFDTSNLPSGTYVLRMSDGSFVHSQEFVVQK